MGAAAESVEKTGPIGRLQRVGVVLEDAYATFDLRWMGVFRVLFGVLLCVDLIRRWAVADDFYTNDGVLPNHFSLFRPLGRNVFSLYHSFSSLPQVNVAFAVTLAIFVTFTLGYRTRLFHALSLVCITSLNARNLLVENGGTVVVNLLCFWTLFLPLGQRFSLDALRRSLAARREHAPADLNLRDRSGDEAGAHSFRSLACFALLLQWSLIYFFNVVHKSGHGWRDGSALHWFLYQDRIVTWFGIFVRENVPFSVLRAFTYATLVVEGALAGLLLVPVGRVWARRVALLFALGLHGGIAATSRLGPFSYVMTLFFLLPLSGADWELAKRWFRLGRRPLTVVYDADCGLCFRICRVLARLDGEGLLRFVASADRANLPEGLSEEVLAQTVVAVRRDGRVSLRERALADILGTLPLWGLGLGLVLRAPGVSRLARLGYDFVAKRRHRLSASLGYGACGVRAAEARHETANLTASTPHGFERLWPGVTRSRFLVRELLAAGAIVMLFNQIAIDNDWARRRIRVKQPVAFAWVVDTFRLLQGWRMFAPEPPYEDGRLVVDARTADGRKLDPLTGLEPDFDPHTDVGWGQTQLWCDYQLKMYFSRYAVYRQHLRKYLENWHRHTGRSEDRLVAFDVWWVRDKSPPPGRSRGQPLEPVRLLTHGRVKDSGAAPWIERAKSDEAGGQG